VVRAADGLMRLIEEIDGLEALHGRTASLAAARLVAACALARAESRGGHFRADAPQADASPAGPSSSGLTSCPPAPGSTPPNDRAPAGLADLAPGPRRARGRPGRAGDVTSQACVPAEARLRAVFVARKAGVIAGLACARLAIAELDPAADFKAAVEDGAQVAAGEKLAWVDANARALLSAERVA